jgi:hypothetical protein
MMNSTTLARLDMDIKHLSLAEQTWLMERLAQYIRTGTMLQQKILENQLAEMAADPDIQREIRMIEAEFSVTESDGLIDEK